MKLKAFLILILFLLVTQTASAKSVEERLKALEDKWAQYESMKVDQNAKLADTIAQLDKIRTELQTFGGGTETQSMQMKQLQENLERHYRDLEMRLNAVDGALKVAQDELNRAVSKLAPQLAEEGKQFQKGLTHVQNVEYPQAIAVFEQFLKQYPKSPSRAEALFWIGECRYAMRDYSQAIKDYQKFVEQFPKSAKAPVALLKQGDAFLSLQMKDEAKVFYKKLIQDFPKSNEAAQAQGKLAAIEKTGSVPLPPVPQPTIKPAAPPPPNPPTNPPSKSTQDF